MNVLVLLFVDFFRISLFVIGGGYAIISVADQIFARRKWTEEGELLDQLLVFQMIPGLIATHTAVYVGRKMAGLPGALVALFAVILPSIAVFSAIAVGYREIPLDNPHLQAAFAGLRASLTGIIAATLVRGWLRAKKDAFFIALVAVGAVSIGVAGVSVAWVLLAAMLLGLGREFAVRGRFHATWLPLLVFFKYGALGFGGGFVLVPMYLQDFVGPTAPYLQIGAEEFSNIMALTQMTPGPIGVNCATYFGCRLAGVPGALLASLALLLPGALLAYLAFVSLERFRASRVVGGIMTGIRPASIALMLVALTVFARVSLVDVGTTALALACAAIVYFKKMNVIRLIALSALVGVLLGALKQVLCT